jgi:hypothetical protein
VRSVWTKSYPCGFVPVRKSRLELSSGGVGSQGRPARAASKWPGRDTSGGITIRPCVCARVLTRLKRSGWLSTPVRGVGEYPRATCRVLGGVTWRKRGENLTDEVPRRSQVGRLGISIVIRPKPKCDVRRRRARGAPWLSLPGDSSVSGGGLPPCLLGKETKRTHLRQMGGRAAWQGSSQPTGIDRARSSPPFPGRLRVC